MTQPMRGRGGAGLARAAGGGPTIHNHWGLLRRETGKDGGRHLVSPEDWWRVAMARQ